MNFASRRRRAVLLAASTSALACLTLCTPASALAHTSAPTVRQSGSPCGTLTTAPTYKHVIVIMDENHSYSDIIGSSQAPYINSAGQQSAGWPRTTTTSPTTACPTTWASPRG